MFVEEVVSGVQCRNKWTIGSSEAVVQIWQLQSFGIETWLGRIEIDTKEPVAFFCLPSSVGVPRPTRCLGRRLLFGMALLGFSHSTVDSRRQSKATI